MVKSLEGLIWNWILGVLEHNGCREIGAIHGRSSRLSDNSMWKNGLVKDVSHGLWWNEHFSGSQTRKAASPISEVQARVLGGAGDWRGNKIRLLHLRSSITSADVSASTKFKVDQFLRKTTVRQNRPSAHPPRYSVSQDWFTVWYRGLATISGFQTPLRTPQIRKFLQFTLCVRASFPPTQDGNHFCRLRLQRRCSTHLTKGQNAS